MYEFLSFKRLISIEVLIGFYYFGAVVMPLLIFWWFAYLRRKYVPGTVNQAAERSYSVLKESGLTNHLWKWLIFGMVMFLFAELFWRLLFEFLIAFMQMRDALVSV